MYFKIAILQTSRFETAKPSGLLRGVLIKKASAHIYIYIYGGTQKGNPINLTNLALSINHKYVQLRTLTN
jgi:hypothetical protein